MMKLFIPTPITYLLSRNKGSDTSQFKYRQHSKQSCESQFSKVLHLRERAMKNNRAGIKAAHKALVKEIKQHPAERLVGLLKNYDTVDELLA